MSRRTAAAVAVCTSALLLVLPGVSQAATKVVNMGEPLTTQKAFQKIATDVNDYFPDNVRIHVGDSIRFVPAGFHTVNLPKRGSRALVPVFGPAGATISGAVDPAGAPFWFNGQPQLGFNSALVSGGGLGKKLTYTGAKTINSGLPVSSKAKPMTVRFTKTGKITYYCDVHPGMKAVVRVVPQGATIPTTAQDAKAVKAQVARALANGRSLASTKPAAGTVELGAAGKDGVERFAMFPATQTVPAGTTVRFNMSKGTFETHTATFGPGDPTQPATFLGKLEATFNGPAPDPAVLYPSDAPGAVVAITPQTHGNGFWSSGALDRDKATPQGPQAAATFTVPGSYTFFCMIHPEMKGTIVVQ